MKLTSKSEYALLALVFLAKSKEEYTKAEDICEKYDLSQKYLEQILQMLNRGGLVISKRGQSGGYQLKKAAEKISIAEVVRLMDGAIAPIESASKYFFHETLISKEKKALKVMKEVRNMISDFLEKKYISDII